VSAQLAAYFQLMRSQWQQQFQLLTLETQRAAECLVAIWLLALLATLLLLSSWVLILVLLGNGLLALGLALWQSIAVLLLLQLSMLLLTLRGIRYYSQFLRFPATQQSWRELAKPACADDAAATFAANAAAQKAATGSVNEEAKCPVSVP
jgi:hypothetical protein